MKKITLFILSWIFFSSLLIANELSLERAESFAESHLLKSPDKHSISNFEILVLQNEAIAYLYHLKPQGFILVSTQETRNPIIGYSWEQNFEIPENQYDNAIFPILEGIHKERKALTANPELDKTVKTKSFVVGPHIYTLWGQVNCHDANGSIINVTNLNTPNHCAIGCVAISLATILNYYEWPPKGKGTHSYYDGSGSLTGTHSANYNYEYPWELMKNKYNNQNTTLQERQAAGLLAYHAAVGVNMNFEMGGSTSNVNNIPYAFSHFFRIHSYYKNINSSNFWVDVDKNMIEANPVAIAIENNNGNGHSMIIDGLKVEDNGDRFYHLNCGWWGATNGWYALQGNFNAGTYTSILGGVVDAIPIAYIPQQSYYGTNVITLSWNYSNTIEANSFKVQQKINNGSWVTLEEEVSDTSLLVGLADTLQDYAFRVKAKVNGEYYLNTWSNTMYLFHVPAGLEEEEIESISISPNPAQNVIVLSNISKGVEVEIYNTLGQQMITDDITINNSTYSINVSKWDKGVYFVTFHQGTKRIVKKFIKN